MNLEQMSSRADHLIDAIASSIISASEAAAERVELASQVARLQTRMAAFGAVLEAVGTQKEVLAGRLESAQGPMKTLIEAQINLLTEQETAILVRAGASRDQARNAVVETDEPLYQRRGKRFERINGTGQ